ncbi:hypothetical protein [Paraburkholderia sp. MM5384-R2]|uniref:hypothetical protein n=1 Tax=Paraburkholderia sp. MM5384-R2 TaxID=2723097 RepID=UPI00161AF3EB|nr:hypothetical protein [Paraburkholderia sp. MM5384-R2]MBB5503276.1 hypothetical protein [Paraburkholderia sp. MM5384-R2]
MTFTDRNPTGVSAYTFRNIDPATDHLEQVLGAQGAESLFTRTYWRGRVLQALATQGLSPNQQQRLQRLLESIDAFPPEISVSSPEQAMS